MTDELKIRQHFHFGVSGVVSLSVDSARAEDWRDSIELAQRLTQAVEDWRVEQEAVKAPEPETAPPTAWNPMETCPRGPDGLLTENVWVGYEARSSLRRWIRGTRLPVRGDAINGRVGWLPGYIAKSDLPAVTP